MLLLRVGVRGRGSGGWGCLRQQHPLLTPESECTVGIKCVVPKQKNRVWNGWGAYTLNLTTILSGENHMNSLLLVILICTLSKFSPRKSTVQWAGFFLILKHTWDLCCKYTGTSVHHTCKQIFFPGCCGDSLVWHCASLLRTISLR